MDTENHLSPRRTVAILSRGDAVARRDAPPKGGRFVDVFEALAAVGIKGHPVIYDESFADAAREQLTPPDGIPVPKKAGASPAGGAGAAVPEEDKPDPLPPESDEDVSRLWERTFPPARLTLLLLPSGNPQIRLRY